METSLTAYSREAKNLQTSKQKSELQTYLEAYVK